MSNQKPVVFFTGIIGLVIAIGSAQARPGEHRATGHPISNASTGSDALTYRKIYERQIPPGSYADRIFKVHLPVNHWGKIPVPNVGLVVHAKVKDQAVPTVLGITNGVGSERAMSDILMGEVVKLSDAQLEQTLQALKAEGIVKPGDKVSVPGQKLMERLLEVE